MANVILSIENELRRLANGPLLNEKPGGIGLVRFAVHHPFEVHEVLTKAKSVLRIVDEAALNGWPKENQSAPILPEWFSLACASDMSLEQAKQWLDWWRGLAPDEQTRVQCEKKWSLKSWLHWMEPTNREWFLWDAKEIEGQNHLALAVEVEAWPFPWGALRWLFRAAGASLVEPEDSEVTPI